MELHLRNLIPASTPVIRCMMTCTHMYAIFVSTDYRASEVRFSCQKCYSDLKAILQLCVGKSLF